MSATARLLSVRMQGFKSFADRTHVEFRAGISAVVGPNGSGKSNLADALRWALGEQGRALRSRKSEDVIWAGSEKRPAVGMADVQLTLDNGDGLLPVEYGVVELGRRLYRSGENDYLLNRQRVRLKDLVDLLDAGHIAENAFLFIGQGMVDQALALRPEERRPLFEEVAGVRRHERRRRRAEEQLVESEANLARVDDILAELRPQARRLAQQAEQQANRLSAADELAAAIILSAHARWYDAASRSGAAAAAVAAARAAMDGAMSELLEHERAMTAAGAALAGQASAEAAARTELDRARAERSALQLREGRNASDLDGSSRERARHAESRAAAEADLAAARATLAAPGPGSTAALEEELAGIDADLAAAAGAAAPRDPGVQDADAAAIRRLEAARAEERAAAARRAADAERVANDEAARAAAARERESSATAERTAATEALSKAGSAEAAARAAREQAETNVTTTEAAMRGAADRAGSARASLGAISARLADAKRAQDAAEGNAFSKAARARGGRSIGDGLIVEPSLKAAVDAALAGFGRALVLPRGEIGALVGERGVAIPTEALARASVRSDAGNRLVDQARALGGGSLAEAIRRDDAGAATALLGRAVWLPNAAACLEIQGSLPAGWLAISRDGTIAVGDVAAWVQPDGRGLHLRADTERLEAERAAADAAASAAATDLAAAEAALREARHGLSGAREHETAATIARRRAEEVDRAAAARAETAARDAAWLAAQAERLATEASRLRAAVPEAPAAPRPAASGTTEGVAGGGTAVAQASAAASAQATRTARLRDRREALAIQLDAARARLGEHARRQAQADAAAALAERQLTVAAGLAADLAEREARLGAERQELATLLADAAQLVSSAEAALTAILGASAAERERLRTAEGAATAGRERVRVAGERSRLAERDEVEARVAIEGLREQLLLELAGLGSVGLVHLRSGAGDASQVESDADVEPAALEAALAVATKAWEQAPPAAEPPPAGRLATLRRRFHDLGAVNPFAADEYAEVRTRLEGLDAQRTDIQAAIERTRELIDELDRLVSDQFRRTFEALERAFDARFQQLFGGGYARLLLTDPADLTTTGIEITARPPGKKPQALAMLSGGERALTAVALLFAMLEVRPVPFCVLDEVDAALDEANIGRFTDALRDLSRQTQCIVITHNRGTIEAADALYGVTVGDDSVSRVISLRLDEATAMASRRGAGGNRTPETVALATGEA